MRKIRTQHKRLAPTQGATKTTKGFKFRALPPVSFVQTSWVPQEPRVKMYLYLLLLVFNGFAFAQGTEDKDTMPIPSHALIGRFQGDSIELRWAPSTYSVWQHAVENGWKLERLELSKSLYNLDDQTPLDGDENLSQVGGLIFPWTEEQYKKRVAKTDTNTAVALQLLYGPTAIPSGSDPLSAMAKLQEEQARSHGFAMMAADFSRTTANALGLRFVDRKLVQGKAYLYRIYIPVGNSDLDLDTIDIVVDTRSPWSPKKVQKVFTESGDEEVSVNWPALNDMFFTAYDVERSVDQKTWKRLNHKPYVVSKSFSQEAAAFFVDTTIEKNYKNYYYRVRGYSAFGDKGLYSDVVVAIGKDFKAPSPAYDIKALDMGLGADPSGLIRRVKVQWGAFATEKDLRGFYVGKSDVAAGSFPKISGLLSTNTREFTDTKVDPLINNYYVIIAVDTSGNESQSYVAFADLQDTVAPAKPTGLVAEIDTFGNVFLNWTEGEEMDIIGYRVYWANDPKAEFSQITGDFVPGINYVDSIELNTLTEKVYYRIAAVDHRYNHSEMSDIMELKRPDKVKPTAPVITGYQIGNGSISIQWIPSSSADVQTQTIRRKTGDGDWTLLKNMNPAVASFVDSGLIAGQSYAYEILATDEANNASEASFPLQVNMIDNSARNGISGLAVNWDKENQTAALSWTLPAGNIAKVLVYRNAGEGLTYYRSLAASATTFNDKTAIPDTQYSIKLIYSDGAESPLSGGVTAR